VCISDIAEVYGMLPTAPAVESAPRTTPTAPRRGLTFRSFIVCIFALLVMGIWIECTYTNAGALIGETSPPLSAIGVILILLAISGVLFLLHRSLGLTSAELIFIFSALLVAAPLMAQGLWGRFFGLLASVPHDQDFKSLESMPDRLWPHGANLCVNGRFVEGLDGWKHEGQGRLDFERVAWKGRRWKSPRITNDGVTQTALSTQLDRVKDGLVPGELYLFSCLVKTSGLRQDSFYFLEIQNDGHPPRRLLVNSTETTPTFANRGGFTRIGVNPVTIPRDLQQRLTLRIGLYGQGKLTIQDVQFFNMRATEGGFVGVKVVRQSHLRDLPYNERDYTLVKPDQMFSLAGARYLLQGFIPMHEWAETMLVWSTLIGALFLGFLGFNVLMRKQWAEYERLSFPMNILPRYLFAEDPHGAVTALLHNRVMWLGFLIMLPVGILKCLHFYYPHVPAPILIWGVYFPKYFTNPLLKVYFEEVGASLQYTMVAICLFIETDMLFSMVLGFFLFRFTFLFGETYNLKRFTGYPWEFQQAIGAFLAVAVLAVYTARRHLAKIFLHIFGRQAMDDSSEMLSYRNAFLLIIGAVLVLIFWGMWSKVGVLTSLLYFGWILTVGFTASKIRAECGMAQGYWTPTYGMMLIGALGGIAVFGTTGMLAATIGSGIICESVFLFMAPVQVEMMALGRRFRVRLRDIGYGLFLGLLGGILIGGFVFLAWTYGHGASNLRSSSWPYNQSWYFAQYRAGEATADKAWLNHIPVAPETRPLDVIHNIDAKGALIGFLITCVLFALRSYFPRFPFHPFGYVLATSYFARYVWFSMFVAWVIRSLVLRFGGVHAIRKGLIPFAVGMILACVIALFFNEAVGFYMRAHGVQYTYSSMP